MTSLILENADLNRLFPKCRPRGGPPPSPGASNRTSQPHETLCRKEEASVGKSNNRECRDNYDKEMIDLERDTSDRTPSVVSAFQDPNTSPLVPLSSLPMKPLSSSSSSASGRSEDGQQYLGVHSSDQQGESQQQDDSGGEESPVYILTSAKGDRSYKLRDSRIIEIAGGREVFSQSRGKVPARKSRFLTGSNTVNNDDHDNKLPIKKNNKSPNVQTIWELRSRCGDPRKHRPNRDLTETVFSSEVHSVRRNTKSILDYDTATPLIPYDHLLNTNVEYAISKSMADLDYGMNKSCGDYRSNNTTPAKSMAIVSDGEVVVFDDIDDNWQGDGKRGSSIASTPSPTSGFRSGPDFFKVITPAPDCDAESSPSEVNHKLPRVIGELPIAQYSGSPRRYGVRDNQLPCLLSSPSVYVTPRPGFPKRVLPSTPNHSEPDPPDSCIALPSSDRPPTPTTNSTTIQSISRSTCNHNNEQDSLCSSKVEDDSEDTMKQDNMSDNIGSLVSPGGSTFDYLYEFSETRKVLEEFFKCPAPEDREGEAVETFPFQDLDYELRRQGGSAYVGQRLASGLPTAEEVMVHESPKKQRTEFTQNVTEHESNFLDLSVGTASSEDLGETEVGLQVGHSRNFTLSPETTDCDSNCGDLDSEVSLMIMDNEMLPASGLLGSVGDLGNNSESPRAYTCMPVLEDGLSSGHASDTDNNNPTVILMKRQINEIEKEIVLRSRGEGMEGDGNKGLALTKEILHTLHPITPPSEILFQSKIERDAPPPNYDPNELQLDPLDPLTTPPPPAPQQRQGGQQQGVVGLEIGVEVEAAIKDIRLALQRTKALPVKVFEESGEGAAGSPIWIPRHRSCLDPPSGTPTATPTTPGTTEELENRRNVDEGDLDVEEVQDDEEADTDLETDRLLGQQRTDDQGFYDDKGWRKPKSRTMLPLQKQPTPKQTPPTSTLTVAPVDTPLPPPSPLPTTSANLSQSPSSLPAVLQSLPTERDVIGTGNALESDKGSPGGVKPGGGNSPVSEASGKDGDKVKKDKEGKKRSRNKEALLGDPSVLIEGVLFRARYLGSTQLVCEGQPTKSTRMCQAEEAVSRIKDGHHIYTKPTTTVTTTTTTATTTITTSDDDCDSTEELIQSTTECLPCGVVDPGRGGTVFRLHFLGSVEVEEEGGRKRRKRLKNHMVEEAVTKIKAPDGETQPSTEVDLFISTEKIMVLNTDLKEIMMDHALRTISYIADIGDLVVLMARRRFVPHEMEEQKINRTPKMICHVFESEEAQFIAQSIGQAFQVAYMEFLKANGIEDHSFVKEMDYQEVLNSQEIFGDELQMFAKKEMQKEVVVPKAKGEILGVVIVESGWGSMLPTVVIANLAPSGAAARCGQLNIGDQIIAINGVSLVGLPLSTCQAYIKNSKNQTVVKLTVVPCAPVVEVKIKRPDTKYQLGFSVQNGVICSLLRGGIAERGGVRVGHRIIEINNQSVVAVPHEKIVNLLATSVGEILMKTMPTSMFRLLTGQESPVYI